MSSIAAPVPAGLVGEPNLGLLRSLRFDTAFVVGTLTVGLLSAIVVTLRPSLWGTILVADLWLLGYHHVVSTYTRLFLDNETRSQHRALLTWVPAIVVVGVVTIGIGIGFWALTTTYLYWQWWHYSRQSWGISRIYAVSSDGRVANHRWSQACFLAVPTWGILWRSAQGPDKFLGADLWTIPVPWTLVHVAAAIAGAAVLWQLATWVKEARRGQLAPMHVLYTGSHIVMFAAAYVLLPDINHGWLAINIWHNAQYIAFVWFTNNKRHGQSPTAPSAASSAPSLIARLSHRENLAMYIVGCIAASTLLYMTIGATIAAVVPAIVIYQAINFHHYVVDSAIWKLRPQSNWRTHGFLS